MAQTKRQPLTTGKNGKHPGGRPSKFRPDMMEQAAKLCALGATDQEMADFWGIDIRTFERWRASNEEFCRVLKVAKAEADNRVERSLYQRAIGYEQQAVKIFMPAGASEPVYAEYRERVAPDTAAAIFWLKNRREKDWKDKRHVEGDHRHHHSAEPVSESSGWLAGMLGAAEDSEASEPLQGGSLLPVEVRPERDAL